jgi:hypothetical protein
MYKWASPHEWLEEAVEKGDVSVIDLLGLINQNLGADEIEDYFQSDMEDDRYFAELHDKPCIVCNKEMEVSDTESLVCFHCREYAHIDCMMHELYVNDYICNNCEEEVFHDPE